MKKFSFDIPIFPLSGAILLPKANLPLNIFEERYISMVDYALSHDKIIGIIQTMGNNNKLFKIGSIGEITSFHKTDDGRYLINLFGIDLFKTTKEIESDNKFRIFNVECKNKKSDESIKIKENFNKLLLIEKFKLFVKKSNPEINFPSIEKIDSHDLIRIIAMSCPFNISEKQMLLESENMNILVENLFIFFDFYANKISNTTTIN